MDFSATILAWYASYGRDLPWRRTRDPYAVWISEIILQQTRIAQGTAYWERFLARFPDVETLAGASEDEVLRLWEGLGYYSRARNLHAAAKQIAAQGAFPSTMEGLRALKGVGEYTAAAIGSIAFGLPAAVVDGNVYRVLARHFGIETPVGSDAAKKEFTSLAQSLLPEGRAGDFNQGMMDFGAIQCTPLSPACLTCPLQESCRALATGRVDALPVKQAARPVQHRYFTYLLVRCGDCVALRRRGPGDIWQGLWEPCLYERPDAEAPAALPIWAQGARLLRADVRHLLTHRTLHADFLVLETQERPPLPEAFRWIPVTQLGDYAKPRLVNILLDSLMTSLPE